MDEVGLDFGLRNNQGHDGLMKAAWNGARELCELLLQRDPKAILGRDRAGLGPPEMARINGHRDLADWLQEYAQDASGETGKKAEARSLPSLTSPAFVVFYRNQALVPPGEWDRLHAALLSPLPVTLRLRPCCHREGLARMLGKASRSGPVRLLPSAVAPISFFQVGSSDWKKDTALQEVSQPSLAPQSRHQLPQHPVCSLCQKSTAPLMQS